MPLVRDGLRDISDLKIRGRRKLEWLQEVNSAFYTFTPCRRALVEDVNSELSPSCAEPEYFSSHFGSKEHIIKFFFYILKA